MEFKINNFDEIYSRFFYEIFFTFFHQTALSIATNKGNIEIIQFLLSYPNIIVPEELILRQFLFWNFFLFFS